MSLLSVRFLEKKKKTEQKTMEECPVSGAHLRQAPENKEERNQIQIQNIHINILKLINQK
jgi:hypothetical protein